MQLVWDHTLRLSSPRVCERSRRSHPTPCLGYFLVTGPHPPLSTMLLPASLGHISAFGFFLKSLSLRSCGGVPDLSLFGQISPEEGVTFWHIPAEQLGPLCFLDSISRLTGWKCLSALHFNFYPPGTSSTTPQKPFLASILGLQPPESTDRSFCLESF